MATPSGLSAYDPRNETCYAVPVEGLRQYINVEAIAEDHQGQIWITTGDGVKRIVVKREAGKLHFFVKAYGAYDGFRQRLFYKRAMLSLKDGRVLAGGIDGVNIITPSELPRMPYGKVVFSDIMVNGRIVGANDSLNGRVLLSQDINACRSVVLRHDEGNLTILLASNLPAISHKPHFLYRLKGLNVQWALTLDDQCELKFNNLRPGHYTLEVRLTDDNGNPLPSVNQLYITVEPPFYLSIWAWIVYLLLAAGIMAYAITSYRIKQRRKLVRMEQRRQREMVEMKMVFLTNISHELRTPLSLIIAPLPELLRRERDSDIAGKLRLIQRNAHQMLRMVNEILDLRRLNKGKNKLCLQHADIVACVRGICKQFTGLTNKDVTLTLLSEAETIFMDFDVDKVEKIATNLLSNAFKFVPDKHRRIDVSLSTQDDSLIMRVSDNGPGVSDEDKQHLFERFYQGKHSQHGGTGIGLNIVAAYANMHNGKVSVMDNQLGGATFSVSLPLRHAEISGKAFAEAQTSDTELAVKPAGDIDVNETKNKHKTADNKQRYLILIVDDNPDFIRFLRGELQDDFRVMTAKDSKEALSVILSERPVLILTDVMMPVMDGNEFCRRVKGNAATADIPVIMLSARLPEENEVQGRDCGADDYIRKPFDLNQLRQRIAKLLNQNAKHEGKITPRINVGPIVSVDEQFVAKATAYVESRLNDTTLSVESMSQALGMSRVNLYRKLVTLTGKTPSEFIRLVRLRYAEKLIMKSQLTVAEIAYRVGFASPRYFAKCYKELFGYLPSQYKQEK